MAAGLTWLAGYLALAFTAVALLGRPFRRTRRAQARAARVAAERAARFGDTVPGTDRDALDTCNAILRETEDRKEKP